MRGVFGLVLVAGLGLAGTAVYMVQNQFAAQQALLAETKAAAEAAVPMVYVIAVNRAIGYGERITPEDVAFIQYAEPHLPEGVFLTQDEFFPEGPEVLRTVLRPMEANEPVLAVKVTEPGGDTGLTQRLAEGMRAFTINVDATSGVSGFLRPGDRVDVYWSGTVSEGGWEPRYVTQLIDSNLKIVAIDQSAEAVDVAASVARTVTVEVSPQQVALLAQAQSTGSLSLSLVGQGDETIATAIEVDQKILLGLEDAPEPVVEEVVEAPPPPKVCTLETRRGTEVIVTEYACPPEDASSSSN
jgi:pilus assembly protein CpaB